MNNSSLSLFDRFIGFWNTPPLWKGEKLYGLEQFDLPEIEIDKEFISEINATYIPAGLRLGKQVEEFFQQGIGQSEDFEVLASNEQIIRNKITVGEIDFILKNGKRIFHTELVYKFYLYDPDFDQEAERWIGPNRNDSLLLKTEKLQEKQLPLLLRSETAELLENLDLSSSDIEQKVCFKANLFLPRNMSGKKISLVNPDCIAGYWISHFEFTQEHFDKCYLYIPDKSEWPASPEHNQKWYYYFEIKEQVEELLEQMKSPLIWMKKDNGVYERFFVVWW